MAVSRKKILSVVVAVAAAGVGFLGARQLLDPRANIEGQLDQLERSDPMLSALAESFPADWTVMRGQLIADAKAGMPMNQINANAYLRSRRFMQEKASATAAAPTPALVSALAAEADLIAQLQRDSAKDCADFAMRGLQPDARLNAATRDKLAVAVRARIAATRQGLDGPTAREAASEADWAAVMARMQANGISELSLAALQNPQGGPVEEQCDGGVHLYRALAELPPEQTARIYAEMNLEAAKTPVPGV